MLSPVEYEQRDIASYACDVEIEKLGEPIGKQDQYACAVGGLNFIIFHSDEAVTVEKILMRRNKLKELQDNLLLFYLGSTRSASAILSEQRENLRGNGAKIGNLHRMTQLSRDLKEELQRNNIDSVGDILHAGWLYKRELASSISNDMIEHYYNLGCGNGATGGKVLGAGGGGFLLFYVRPEDQDRLRRSMSDLHEYPFEFDSIGTTVIYYD